MTIKNLVEHVLEQYPETRADDTKLYFKCGELLGARTTHGYQKLGLSIVTIHKIRQVIQNKEGKYLPDQSVIKERQQKEKEMREYIKSFNLT